MADIPGNAGGGGTKILPPRGSSDNTPLLPPDILERVFTFLVKPSEDQTIAKITTVNKYWKKVLHRSIPLCQASLLFRVRCSVDIIHYHPSKIEALTVIAVFSNTIGQKIVSESCLRKASSMISAKKHQSFGIYHTLENELEYIAGAKAKLGKKVEAIKVADRISWRKRIKLKLDLGYMEEAILDANSISDPYSKGIVLSQIGRAQAARGDIDAAKETAGLISDSESKSLVTTAIAIQLVKQNTDLDQVLKEVSTIPNDIQKNIALRQVIRILAESNKIKKAKQVLAQIKDKQVRVYSEIAIAEFHEESGDIEGIIESGKQIGLLDTAGFTANILQVQLKRLLSKGGIHEVQNKVKVFPQCYEKNQALLAVMQWCIKRENIKAAKAMAEIISSGDADVYRKNVALRLLAGAYASGGNFSAAREAINDISAAEERIKAEFEVYRIREERDREKILAAE